MTDTPAPTETHRVRAVLVGLIAPVIVIVPSGIVGARYMFWQVEDAWIKNRCNYTGVNFSPAVMLACGRGFVEPISEQIPALAQFLDQKTATFSASDLPNPAPVRTPMVWHFHHRYLSYLVGYVWRVFGVSWWVFKALLVVLLCITVLLVYGIFRIALNRGVSTVGALVFLISPEITYWLPNIRDFIKATFILAAILLVGRLIKGPVRMRALWGTAILLGLVIGVGIGFRHDVQVCLYLGIAILAVCAVTGQSRILLARLAAIALLLATFVATGWPILKSYHETGTPSHDALMGLASVHEERLGLSQASYERMYMMHDFFVYASATDYVRRVEGWTQPPLYNTREEERSGERLLREVIRTFPGDLITRAYAGVLWVLGGAFMVPEPSSPLVLAMTCAAALALLIISARSVRSAWLTLFVALYLGSYITLQFHHRHAFYLRFVSIWILAFLLAALGRTVRGLLHAPTRKRIRGATPRAARRMAAFAVSTVLALLAPLYVARAYQSHGMERLYDKYVEAALEPLQCTQHPLAETVLFSPANRLGSEPCSTRQGAWPWHAQYLVAEFAATPEPRTFHIKYESQEAYTPDYSWRIRLGPTGAGDQGRARYFFPVYENADVAKGGWCRFAGLAVPSQYAQEFKQFYRVTNVNEFPLLLNFSLPSDKAYFSSYQSLGATPPSYEMTADLLPQAVSAPRVLGLAQDRTNAGDWEGAASVYRNALSIDQTNMTFWQRLGMALEMGGQTNEALQAYRKALSAAPDFVGASYSLIDGMFAKRNDFDGRIAAWRAVVQEHPQAAHAYGCLAAALEEGRDLAGAAEARRKATELDPCIEFAQTRPGRSP